MYEYRCQILKVVDGDTVDVDIDLGFGVWLRNERVRMIGIDTPESRTSDKVEKVFGTASKNRLKSMLRAGTIQVLKTQVDKDGGDAKGKFGRILGDFVVFYQEEDREVTATYILIKEGHAVPYFGGSKDEVQEQHMKNRKRLVEEGIVKLEK